MSNCSKGGQDARIDLDQKVHAPPGSTLQQRLPTLVARD